MKLLSIGTDRALFQPQSAVRARQINYAKNWGAVHIIVFGGPELVDQQISDNCFIYSTHSTSRWFYLFGALRLGRRILKQQSITHLTCQDPFETGIVGWWLQRLGNNLKLELQLHTDLGSPYFARHSWFNRIRWCLAHWTIPRADHLRVVSAKIANFLIKHWRVSPEKIEIRPITVPVKVLTDTRAVSNLRANFPQFEKIALVVSRLETEKDVALALGAWAIVTTVIPAAGLIIAGSGREEGRLRELSRSLGIEKQVVFAGWVNNLTAYYAMADVVVCPSQYEGYGLALVEAHQAGRPIVSTDVGVARELGATIVGHQPRAVAEAVISKLLSR